MEGISIEMLLNKIKEQMAIQTLEITEAVTKSVSNNMDEKIAVILEENKSLKTKVEVMQQKINYLEDEKRKNNLIFFGVSEAEQDSNIIDYIIRVIGKEAKITLQPSEINRAYRLGPKGSKTRPVLVSFTTTWKRNLILGNRNKFGSSIYIKEDHSKETLEKRKELIPQMLQERQKGKIAFIKKDKLIVKDPEEDNKVKRKRDQVESPNNSPGQATKIAPKKNKISLQNFITRGRSASLSETKN